MLIKRKGESGQCPMINKQIKVDNGGCLYKYHINTCGQEDNNQRVAFKWKQNLLQVHTKSHETFVLCAHSELKV